MTQKKKPPQHPREAWVLENPDGYVVRKLIPNDQRREGQPSWDESPLVDRHVAGLAARIASRFNSGRVLFYAARRAESGELHLALVDKRELV